MPVQYGGGLRTVDAVRDALRAGAERVIVGTAALRDVDFLDDIVAAHGPRVVVSVDVRGGKIATAGWTQVTDMPAADAIGRLHDRGVASFIYTDADRDGALGGPSLEDVAAIAEAVRGRFLYAGRDRRARAPALAARAAPGQPVRRDRRQGALRAALHGRRGAGRARRQGLSRLRGARAAAAAALEEPHDGEAGHEGREQQRAGAAGRRRR